MIEWNDIAAAWNMFFFRPEPLSALVLFRFGFGLLIIANAAFLACEVRLWFGPDGLFGREEFRRAASFRWSLFRWLPPRTSSACLVLALSATAGVCLALGVATRVAAIAAFLTLVALHQRNAAITHSGDAVLRLMAFLLIFTPAGRPFDIADLLSGRSAAVETAAPWGVRLMQIQIAVIYLRTTFEKLRGKSWRNGTAAHWPMVVEHYRRFHWPAAARAPLLIHAATWSTLAVELSLGSLIWIRELRYPVVACGIALHLLIELVLDLQLFGITMIVCLLLFLPPADLLGWIA